jgi:hypothetical protein
MLMGTDLVILLSKLYGRKNTSTGLEGKVPAFLNHVRTLLII